MLVVTHGLMGKEPQIKTLADALMTLAAFIATLILATLAGRFFGKANHQMGTFICLQR